MDLDGLFWIALIVFYFISRALGGGRQKQGRAPKQQKPRPQRSDDLELALDEIREALGFPKEQKEPEPVPEPEERVPLSERPQRDLEGERLDAALEAKAEAESKRESAPGGTEIQVPKRAGRPGRIPVGSGLPPAGRPRKPEPREGLHPIRPTFREEEAFEQLGPHQHVTADVPVLSASPYEPRPVPARRITRQLGSVNALRTAIVLKEILDRPLSLRGRRQRALPGVVHKATRLYASDRRPPRKSRSCS